jgi:DNA polymerase II large subunit
MEKITDLPLGGKFVRQSFELTAIEAKLRRPRLTTNRREALQAHRNILASAMARTMEVVTTPFYWAQVT